MFNEIYKGKKVLVTGATGFKGSWLCLWLNQLGAEVYGIANGIPTQPSMFEDMELHQQISYSETDVRNPDELHRTIDKIRPDFIFHLAAQAVTSIAFEQPLETLQTNIMGTANLLDYFRVQPYPCTLIIITSDKCYENNEWIWSYREEDRLGGKDPYSVSKASAEFVIRTYFHCYFNAEDFLVRIASTRAGNVIGGGDWTRDRILPDTFKAWIHNKPLEMRHPNAVRPWQFVLEPLSGYLLLGQLLSEGKIASGEAYNFGPANTKAYTVEEIIRMAAACWDRDTAIYRKATDDRKNFNESTLLKISSEKANQQLDWHPVYDVAEAVTETALWYKNYQSKQTSLQLYSQQQIASYTRKAKEKKVSWAGNY